MQHRAAVSYACIAAVSAVLSSAATCGALSVIAPAFAQAAAPAGTVPLLTQPLPDLPGREVRITLLDRGPGDRSPAHRHPGHYTFGYVVEGTYELGIDGQPPRTLKAGDVFYEPPGVLHSMSHNPSSDKPMKIVVFMVADFEKPQHSAGAMNRKRTQR